MHMYSTDARAMCIKAYIQLKSLRKTSTLTGVSKSTIQRWATTNPIVLRSQKARKATTEAVQRIVELVSSHPFDTPAKIATRIHDELKLHLSTSAVKFWQRTGSETRSPHGSCQTDVTQATREQLYRDGTIVMHPDDMDIENIWMNVTCFCNDGSTAESTKVGTPSTSTTIVPT